MHLKLIKVAQKWYRVLETRGMYSDEREAYDKAVVIVNGVTLLSSKGLALLDNKRGRYSSNYDVVNVPKVEKDYSQQVFLTNTEFKNFFAQAAVDLVKSLEGVSFYIDRGFVNSDYKIVMYHTAEVNYTGNIYKDTVPTMDVIHVHKIEKMTTNVFNNQAEKDEFLQNELLAFTVPMLKKMKGK